MPQFNLRVDATGLPEGVHVAEILALDSGAGASLGGPSRPPAAGPLFRVPVTVIKPRVLPKGGEPAVLRCAYYPPPHPPSSTRTVPGARDC